MMKKTQRQMALNFAQRNRGSGRTYYTIYRMFQYILVNNLDVKVVYKTVQKFPLETEFKKVWDNEFSTLDFNYQDVIKCIDVDYLNSNNNQKVGKIINKSFVDHYRCEVEIDTANRMIKKYEQEKEYQQRLLLGLGSD